MKFLVNKCVKNEFLFTKIKECIVFICLALLLLRGAQQQHTNLQEFINKNLIFLYDEICLDWQTYDFNQYLQ